MRKFKELYFYKQENQNSDKDLVLVAIDVIGNKLVVVAQDKELKCKSVWLEQNNNFYTFDLSGNSKGGLVKYNIPKWKINDEKMRYPDCGI